ncbi:DNA-directed RNA polymerase subunit beta'' [Gossypium arboreum]|uniref:DNA-directed RNA polymerase subunit beta n=1 Tax=Gossypium arboreum TaxID=29729 RepID=A0A0B0Q3E1_GOSAR|nr:DNA-directed RNA polymerase subunit beta'' [Gossypium arboreum]
MKDIKAIVSSKIVEDRHHTIEPYFVDPNWGGKLAIQMAYFFPQWVETRACVSAVCDARLCSTFVCPLVYPTIVSQQMNPERPVANDDESNTPAPAQGTVPSDSRPATSSCE